MLTDDQSSLFTGVLLGPGYYPPNGFAFEGSDPPIMVSLMAVVCTVVVALFGPLLC